MRATIRTIASPEGLFICRNCTGLQNRRKQYKNHQIWYNIAVNEFTFNLLTKAKEASYISTHAAELYYCTHPIDILIDYPENLDPNFTMSIPKKILWPIYVMHSIVTIPIAFKICKK